MDTNLCWPREMEKYSSALWSKFTPCLYIPDIESIREDAGGNQTVLTRSFCAEGEWIPLAEGTDVPELNVGFPDVDYTAVSLTNVPLRLGLVNLKDNSRELTIPIQNKIDFGVEGENHVLRALNSLEKKKVFLQRSGDHL